MPKGGLVRLACALVPVLKWNLFETHDTFAQVLEFERKNADTCKRNLWFFCADRKRRVAKRAETPRETRLLQGFLGLQCKKRFAKGRNPAAARGRGKGCGERRV